MKKTIQTLAPALLVLLFTYAAVSKLADPATARQQMYNQNIPPEAAGILWILVPAAELLTTALLFSERTRTAGLLLSAVLMAVFTGYIALVLAGLWDRVPCSCGGVLQNLSWRAHFIFNIFFLALSTTAWYQRYKGKAENLRKE
ncbi:MauE/DoxX family redox-associated membrane protein [Mucilaginibacter conchicola]|uniref:MauE/DoxX family redox-associated membrane protein n=1 Tax=Mucilaginibacter conchicola TaxID=2303333 RepID=UPI0011C0D4D0|nr:MauE/DoxX family redox-associated membrane protein [Mucilaginibacter conchicola]